MDRILIRKDSYYDSVFLMSLSAELGRSAGLEAGHVVLATPANRELLGGQGFDPAPLAALGPTDLVVALRGPDAATLDSAAARLDELLSPKRGGAQHAAAERPIGLAGGLAQLPGANLALISVPGQYAAYEAAKALEQGLHVMIFSDNVPVEDEVALKRRASERGLLVMGPDCGTAHDRRQAPRLRQPRAHRPHRARRRLGHRAAGGLLPDPPPRLRRLAHDRQSAGATSARKVGGLSDARRAGHPRRRSRRPACWCSSPSRPPPKVARQAARRGSHARASPSVVVFLGDEPREESARRRAQDPSQAAWMRRACWRRPPTTPEEKVPAPDTDELVARMTRTQRHLHGRFAAARWTPRGCSSGGTLSSRRSRSNLDRRRRAARPRGHTRDRPRRRRVHPRAGRTR